jgi:hypothetical protein
MARDSRGGRRRLSYANVMSTLAVFLVLVGGTALAAGLRKNSVNSKTVKNNSLQSVDLKDGGVSGADVADGSLSGADLADSSLNGTDVADGSLKGADIADGSLTGADIATGKNALGAANLAPNSVNSSNVLDNSLRGADLGANVLTGTRGGARGEIDESTLDRVPEAAAMSSLGPGGFISSETYVEKSPNEEGMDLGDGTFMVSEGCKPGDVVLSGGPINAEPSTSLVASFRSGNTWSVIVHPPPGGDAFNVNVVCANQG